MSPWLRATVGFGIAAVALLAVLLARQIPSRHVKGDPGPQALPVVTAVVVLAGAAAAGVADARVPASVPEPWAQALAIAAATVAYLALLPLAGFVAATALYLIAVSSYLDSARQIRWRVRLALGFGIPIALWWVFDRWLLVIMPAGPWGF